MAIILNEFVICYFWCFAIPYEFPLEIVFNKSLTSGEFPDSMKIAKIKSLHKDGSREDRDNYRPISLLPVISKVLEKIVYLQIVSHIDNNHPLFPKQIGFRKGHSTIGAIRTFLCEAIEGIDTGNFVFKYFYSFNPLLTRYRSICM